MDGRQPQERDEFFDLPPAQENNRNNGGKKPRKSREEMQKRAVFCAGAVCLAVIIGVLAFLGGWYGYYYSLDEEMRTFLLAKRIAEQNYYSGFDEDAFYGSMFDLFGLDRYSCYYAPEKLKEYLEEDLGRNSGSGLSFSAASEGEACARVFRPVENSPADLAGLRSGMYVFSYGTSEETLASGTLAELKQFCSSQDQVLLKCGFRADGSDARVYEVGRTEYQAAFVYYRDSETSFRFRYGDGSGSVESVLTETGEPIPELGGKTAYIRLNEFSGFAEREIAACLDKMKERGRTDLILDLRSNGGGDMDVLCGVAAHLLRNAKETRPVVSIARFRDGKREYYRAKGNDFSRRLNVSARVRILADENTASASECLIGALVDHGTVALSDIFLRENKDKVAKTYGKGIMQRIFTNLNGAGYKLTVAEVFWPSERGIHGVGVTPSHPAAGAVPVPADLVWGEEDAMLRAAIASLA